MRRFCLSLGLLGLLLFSVGCGGGEKDKNKGKDVPVPVMPLKQPEK
jgi:hypothetical protein